jgi:glycosyltransferase involved in cell wall biosynthesis
MKISQIMLSKGWGGAERYFIDLCTALAAEGHQIQAICRPNFDRVHLLDGRAGITVNKIAASSNWDIFSYLCMKRTVQQFTPDLIHTHLSRSTKMGGWVGHKLSIPVVTKTANFIKPKYFSHSGWFICTTGDLRRHIVNAGISESRIRIIPNFSVAVPVDSPPVQTDLPPVFISMGRFVRKKGYNILIDAFKAYMEKGGEGRLIIGGDGPMLSQLKDQVAVLGLSAYVDLPGWVEDTESFLDKGDIFVLPSLDEPFGIVILEAMARGKPIISTEAGVVKEILSKSESAWSVPPGDVHSLASVMGQAAANPAERALKGKNALDLYRNKFYIETVLPQIIDYYEEIITLRKSDLKQL